MIIVQGTDDDWLHGYWAGTIGTDKTDTKTFTVPFVLQLKLLERIIRLKNTSDDSYRQCPMDGTKIRRKDTDKNKLGLTLEDYVNAQVLACSELDVPYDAYHTDYFKILSQCRIRTRS